MIKQASLLDVLLRVSPEKYKYDPYRCILWLSISMDDEKVDTTGFAIDKENLKIWRTKNDAVLMNDDKLNEKKPRENKLS